MTFFPVIAGPVAPFSNVPIAPQNYQPSQFVITAIALGITTIVTMANSTNNVPPNYVVGQLVRLNIPAQYGASQINQQTGIVLSLPAPNQVEIGINSTNSDPFIPFPTFVGFQSRTPPQIVAVGDQISGVANSSGRANQSTFIPGSFINISP